MQHLTHTYKSTENNHLCKNKYTETTFTKYYKDIVDYNKKLEDF